MPARKNKPLAEPTEESLREHALTYVLSRATTVSRLRGNLQRKVMTYCQRSGADPEKFGPWIEDAVNYCVKQGYVNDKDYADRFLDYAQERGDSILKVREKLARRGVPSEIVQEELANAEYDDLEAAKAHARKKGIGMFRPYDRDKHRDRDMKKLAGRGFGYEVCRKIVEGDPDDDDDQA